MHCGRVLAPALTRREMLLGYANGFGAVSLAALWAEQAQADAKPAASREPHFPPRARNVIFLYMDGGPSQVDTFDYKPLLDKLDGQDPHKAIGRLEPTQFANVGKVMASPWKFRQYGHSGAWVSDLFPYVSEVVDDLAFVK